MSSPIQEFADNLKMLRKARELTQTQLAEKVGLTKQSIINYEKGVTFPTGNRLDNLLKALNVSAVQLLGQDLSQPTSEKALLSGCNDKAQYIADYQWRRENNENDSVMKQYLLEKLNKFSIEELHTAVLAVHDRRIDLAKRQYTNEITDSILHPGEGLNIDIVVKQNEDEQ